MMKRILYIMLASALMLSTFVDASAQLYRRENRRGGRAFAGGNYDKAVRHYENSLKKDTVNTIPLLYNMAYVLHSDRRDSTQNMAKDTLALEYLDKMAESVVGTEHEYDYHFNRGVIAIDMKDWQNAVDEFKKCLIMDPEDMKARENYIYAKKHLQENNGGGGGGNNDQNQDQQNQDQQNQDQNQDQNQQDQGQNQDQQDNQQNQDQQDQQQDQGNQDQQDQKNDEGNQNQQEQDDKQQGQGQPHESKISPQAAKQILQAMQAKERETQDKVEKKKAAAMKSKQKQKNW